MGILRKAAIGLIPFAVEMGIKKSQAPKNIALKAVASILFLVGAIFGLIALHQYLNTLNLFQPLEVNLIFGAGFVLLALIIFIAVQIRVKAHERKNTGLLSSAKNALTSSNLTELPSNIKDTAQQSIANISRVSHNVKTDMHKHTSKYLLAAAVFGLLWGARTRGKKSKN